MHKAPVDDSVLASQVKEQAAGIRAWTITLSDPPVYPAVGKSSSGSCSITARLASR